MTTLNGRIIAVPHLMICRIERAIVVDERARYSAHESGNALREAELDLELSILLREYFNRTGRTYYSQFPREVRG